MAPTPQPSAPALEQGIVLLIVITVVSDVAGGLLEDAVRWYLQTGVWVFEELLAYYLQQLK